MYAIRSYYVPSSNSAVTSFIVSWLVFLSITFILVVIGTISSRVQPSARAFAARSSYNFV